MKKTLLTLLLGLILISCGQIKKHNMQKDAKEYLEVVLQAADTKTLNEIDGISILSVYLDSNVTIKKKSILQKYQGDDLVEFTDILKSEIKKQTGDDAADMLMLVLIKEDSY